MRRYALALVLGLIPQIASACPTCAVGRGDTALAEGLLLGAMILLPFVILAVALPALKRVMAVPDFPPLDSEKGS